MKKNHTKHAQVGLLQSMFSQKIDSEKKRLGACLMSTFVLGLLAHGYGFLSLTISHDSLYEFYLSVSGPWKIALGRFMEPILRYLMGEVIVLPWLTGVTGLLFAGLAVYGIARLFDLDTLWETVLISGVCVTNVTMTAMAATYIHDFAGDMLALLLAVCAAYAWAGMKDGLDWKRSLVGAACLAASFGFYQAYLAVTITLMVIAAIMDLLEGAKAKEALKRLLRALPMGLLSVALYALCVFVFLNIFGLTLDGDEGNNMSYVGSNLQRLASLVKEGYGWVITDLIVPNDSTVHSPFRPTAGVICLFNGILLVLSGLTVLDTFRNKRMKLPEILLTLLLAAIAPACMVCVGFVSTVFHHLTRWAVCLYYLLVLLLFRLGRKNHTGRWRTLVPAAMIAVVLLNNLAVANIAYEKKELERQAMLSTMTRALTRLESYEDYAYGVSQVAFIGTLNMYKTEQNLGPVDHIVGLKDRTQITNQKTLEKYFEIVLQYPIHLCSDEKRFEIVETEAFKNMGSFPEKDCIATINGVVVVKMSDDYPYA